MSLLLGLCLGLCPGLWQGQDPYAEAMALLEEGRYSDAWEVLADDPDPVRRTRGQATLYLRAGDFAGELEAAEEGLTHAPTHLELLYYAAQAALWMRDDERAEAYLDRLERALADSPPPDAAAADAWRASVETFRSSVTELVEARDARASAIGRARTITYLILALSLAGMLYLALRTAR